MAPVSQFTMPSLGADMDAGTVVEWLVEPGDVVHKGDVVAVIDTAKAAVDVECFASGTVQEILVDPGRSVPIGTVLATIASAGEEPASSPPTAPTVRARADVAGSPSGAPAPASHADGHSHVICSPLVRKDAARLGVDLDTVHGTGVGGRVRREDVDHVAHPEPVATAVRRPVSPYARRLAGELGVDLAAATVSTVDGAVHA
ncbi:MAG: biotin/lipoyl-containing protein, partial [Kineosporiaceae bacterium]